MFFDWGSAFNFGTLYSSNCPLVCTLWKMEVKGCLHKGHLAVTSDNLCKQPKQNSCWHPLFRHLFSNSCKQMTHVFALLGNSRGSFSKESLHSSYSRSDLTLQKMELNGCWHIGQSLLTFDQPCKHLKQNSCRHLLAKHLLLYSCKQIGHSADNNWLCKRLEFIC